VRDEFLAFSPPTVGSEEAEAAADAIRSGWVTTGPSAAQLEREFASVVGANDALALSSCTAGLHVALVASGVERGDEVVTTPMSFASSAHVIEQAGALPVLVDVEDDTLCMDPVGIDKALTDRTRAVLPVHYAGHPADLDPIREMAAARGVHLIEDAAHALPASYRGERIGSGPNPVAFSFYATKNLTTGEGGMLTGDSELIERARVLALHGMSRDAWDRYQAGGEWLYDVTAPGFKYNLPDPLAAIGLVQLSKLDAFQARRRAIVDRYMAAFRGEEALQLPVERPEVEHSWHLFVLRLNLEQLTIDRARFIEEMRARNIGTSVHFIPIHLHSYYRDRYGYAPEDFPVAYENYLRIVSLPLTPALTDHDVDDVIEAVLDVVSTFRR
jgi:dTDP-4-amino-4,6-dideoxygalactose transaminase